ncbi:MULTISPECIES: DNA-3-methyladenine glycosylase [Acidiphilium]|jgi:DNA-3-methyladenine glycosylase II|uniref:DNA-3-methyladenine glycosylase II n=2 Tax=Acidiphilium TaxID=522 RepID=F0J4W1_ACIMA|nr:MULTISPECIES: DNA-3-methyladenine glycosylase [Acidiphilium]MBU6356852.1 DNA-3-methyladenine glycosylase 2 family protein [Rhodospirillales bacterium]KDM66178.1 DNA-3-methyladenine glycosylase II [Acidiphilium sp. JA12-A1]MBS3024261.1 DNA-3-methyladenine glycosylase 2 family protein [Acidiphilium multivorum]MDE2327675.1 DNA-3-methyladenine glycosylase 2 family protein [Rhodospirillales bacterium]UNC14259.1 DNA-3-methyladenine glycosylase 2 family protein [Acidiphilium multivorum]
MSRLARAHLAAADPVLGALIREVGRCTLAPERAREPYEALISAVAHQQLHARAAEAMLGRLRALTEAPVPAPGHLLSLSDEALRGCGFSAAKAAALRDIARRTLDGTVPTRRAAARMSDAALIERLCTLRGIGRWTVEMLLIFTLGRPDVFPVDDFGVREGYRLIHGLEAQPKPRAFAAIGEAYAPYRSTAAWYLWRAADRAKTIKYQA